MLAPIAALQHAIEAVRWLDGKTDGGKGKVAGIKKEPPGAAQLVRRG